MRHAIHSTNDSEDERKRLVPVNARIKTIYNQCTRNRKLHLYPVCHRRVIWHVEICELFNGKTRGERRNGR